MTNVHKYKYRGHLRFVNTIQVTLIYIPSRGAAGPFYVIKIVRNRLVSKHPARRDGLPYPANGGGFRVLRNDGVSRRQWALFV